MSAPAPATETPSSESTSTTAPAPPPSAGPTFILPPPYLTTKFNPSKLIMKLMAALPELCRYADVEVHDIYDVDQWRACGNSCLLKVGLAKPGGSKKEVYNVTAIWLRMIATTHQEDPICVTMLVQQWFNMFGRWPITMAYFVTAANDLERLWGVKKEKMKAASEGESKGVSSEPGSAVEAAHATVDRDSEGNEKTPSPFAIQDMNTVKELPESLKGDTYIAAMYFKQYLTQLAKQFCALPMVPIFWDDMYTTRLLLSRVMQTQPVVSPRLAHETTKALQTSNSEGHTPDNDDSHVEALKNLQIHELSSPSSSRSSTPRGTTDNSDGEDKSASEIEEANGKTATPTSA